MSASAANTPSTMERVSSAQSPSTQPGCRTSTRSGTIWLLRVVYPPELAALEVPLEPGTVLGRSPPVVLPHETVSRRHALVSQAPAGLALSDLESRNGTSVDGLPAHVERPLMSQSVVRLGDVLGVVEQPVYEGVGLAPDLYAALPGRAPAAARLRRELARVGSGSLPVLVVGETGTGKERIAGAIHRISGRSGPFVAVSCAEIAAQLFESELFGHERGAFTGAQLTRSGLFRAAEGGTLFLDEIGELPPELQPKLLRVLQEGEVRPVGGSGAVRVDVRVVAATNRDLSSEVEAGTFRRDLYARLAFSELRVPALRDRRVDILDWVHRFWEARAGEEPPHRLVFTPDAAQHVLRYPWPDNLRGLERLAHRIGLAEPRRRVSRARLEQLLPDLFRRRELPEDAQGVDNAKPETPEANPKPRARRARPTREELLAAYEASQGSVHALSRVFGKDRRQIYRWLRDLGIERGEGASPAGSTRPPSQDGD